MSDAIANAVRRFVPTEAGGQIGSGVIIATGFVLTCFHALKVDNGIKVNDVEADIIAVDPAHDLAMLHVPTVECGAIHLDAVLLGEQVFTVGNPHGFSGALMFGRVCYQTDKRILHDMHGAPGISGAGLFDMAGSLVGLNHSVIGTKHIGNWFTAAVPSEQMQDILRKVFSLVQPTPEEVAKYGKAKESATVA